MFKDIKCHAIVLAAGKGARFGSDIPKQFMPLCNKPVILHSLQMFEEMECIKSIIIVVLEDYIDYCIKITNGLQKICNIVPGGNSRQKSVYNGIKALHCNDDDIILIHDGARPLVKTTDALSVAEAAYTHNAAVLASTATDTVKLSNSNLFAIKTLRREELYLAQTPQAFRKGILVSAHENEKDSEFSAYDDCHVVEKIGIKPKIVVSGNINIKITHSLDLELAEFLMKKGSNNLV